MFLDDVITDIIESNNDIYDCFIGHEYKGITAQKRNDVFLQEKSERVFAKLMKTHTLFEDENFTIVRVTSTYEDLSIEGFPLGNRWWLVVSHCYELSNPLLRESLRTATKALKEYLSAEGLLNNAEPSPLPQPPSLPTASVSTPEVKIDNDTFLQTVEVTLGKVIGPMSSVILKDIISNLGEEYHCSSAQKGMILRLITNELDNVEQQKKFDALLALAWNK